MMADRSLPHQLQCMEVYGGVTAAEEQVSTPGLDGWLFSRPYADGHAGGDIHYLSLCGHGFITRLVIADVAGHGETVSEVAQTLRDLMKRHINTPDQTALVGDLNGEFSDLARGGTFATALLGTYFAADDSLVTCNAGHPRPLWYRAQADEWALLHEDLRAPSVEIRDLPLGVMGQVGYSQFAVPLGRDDLLVMYTDSLMEARDGQGRVLRESGLLELARQAPRGAPDELGRYLLEAVRAYGQGQPLRDDVTLLVLHHNADDPPPVG